MERVRLEALRPPDEVLNRLHHTLLFSLYVSRALALSLLSLSRSLSCAWHQALIVTPSNPNGRRDALILLALVVLLLATAFSRAPAY